jgi:hypothetical protein
MIQLDLFQDHPKAHLFPYWRKRLAEWPRDVMESRRHPHTTGWSMATQALHFAIWLHRNGQMTLQEFRRWCRFNRRVRRWDAVEGAK